MFFQSFYNFHCVFFKNKFIDLCSPQAGGTKSQIGNRQMERDNSAGPYLLTPFFSAPFFCLTPWVLAWWPLLLFDTLSFFYTCYRFSNDF